MKSVTIIGIIILALLVIGGVYFYSKSNYSSGYQDGKGKVAFVITDAAANMGAVSKVEVTVEEIQVHSASQGWVTVSSNAKTYDLLELKAKGTNSLLVESDLKEDTYNQIRLDVSKVMVTDSDGSHEAKLPSNQIIINQDVEVKENSTTSAKFDFIADESLHVTGNGKYILAPVIQIETRSDADVDARYTNDVKINSGNVKSSTRVGMDISGNVGVGLGIASNADISLSDSGVIVVGNGNGASNGLGINSQSNSSSGIKAGIGY